MDIIISIVMVVIVILFLILFMQFRKKSKKIIKGYTIEKGITKEFKVKSGESNSQPVLFVINLKTLTLKFLQMNSSI